MLVQKAWFVDLLEVHLQDSLSTFLRTFALSTLLQIIVSASMKMNISYLFFVMLILEKIQLILFLPQMKVNKIRVLGGKDYLLGR